ncbi:ubiquitin-conjugating enzyme E2 [Candidatus Electronema sp. PJ]|uniref:ubiquitin-conjugating enzyme E2 n=1 Tax=Candidatus Electronema sp. PJ TaxID=3401572 RepID=UPI003AA8A1A6
MASQTDQRATDFEEVKKVLAQQPRINLVQTEGEPPDCYEIEYRVAGLVKEADGSIRKASQHIVLITLPFGYPHFPPTVKPLTPIFHPDIDPDAVRISSRWLQDQSLARLLLYVGEMLCGKVYSLEEPFNQEAADWYAEHTAELPFDSLAGADTAAVADPDEFDLGFEDIDLNQLDSQAEPQSGLSLELEPPQAIHDISELGTAAASASSQGSGLSLELEPKAAAVEEDFDLGIDDSATDGLDLGLEIGEPEDVSPPPQEDFGPKLKEIRGHVDRKEMTIAGRLLAELPALPEAEELRKKVRAAQEQCDELLQEMKMLEDEDNFPEAQQVFEKLKKVIVDMPGLADIGRRLQQSQSMLATFSLKEEEPEPQVELPGSEKKKKKPAAKEAPPPLPKEKQKPAEQPKEKKEVVKTKSKIARAARQEIPVAPFVIAAVVAAVIIAVGLIYTRDSNVLLEAELHWQEAQGLVKRNDFRGAEEKANAALSKVKTVLTPLPEKGRLKKEIAALFANEEFKQGKDGKRKYKGKEMPLAEAEKREQIDKLTVQAEALQQSNISEAAALYEKAVEIATAAPAPLPAEAARCQEAARQLRQLDSLGKADKAEQIGDWDQVVKSYVEALKFCKNAECDPINKKKTKAIFNRELNQAKMNFRDARGQWQELFKKLTEAKKLLEENPENATAEKRQELDSLLVRSQFYQLLSRASEAYHKGDVAIAIDGYQQSLVLLKEKQALFAEGERNAAGKISRTISLIEIGQAWNAATEDENAKDLPAALRHYKELQNLLNKPGLTKDESLFALEQKANDKVSSLSQQADRKRKMDWLNRNFTKIFTDAYPSSNASALSDPGYTLERKSNGLEIYWLHAIERSKGSSYRLELRYLYNPATDQWLPYRGE